MRAGEDRRPGLQTEGARTQRLMSATPATALRASATPPTTTRAGTSRPEQDRDREYGDVERNLIELGEGTLGIGYPTDRDQDPDGKGREDPHRGESQAIDARSCRRNPECGADSEQPPSCDARVGPSRGGEAPVRIRKRENSGGDRGSHGSVAESHALLAPYPDPGHGPLQNGHVQGAEPASCRRRRGGCRTRRADSGVRLRRRTLGGERLQGVPADRRRGEVHERRPGQELRFDYLSYSKKTAGLSRAWQRTGGSLPLLVAGNGLAALSLRPTASGATTSPSAVGSGIRSRLRSHRAPHCVGGHRPPASRAAGPRLSRRSHRA